MSELVLVTIPAIFQEGSKELHGQQVVGIWQRNGPTFVEYGYRPDGSEQEELFRLPPSNDGADRLYDFYMRTRVPAPEDRAYHNCHLLGWYVLGKASELVQYSAYLPGRDAVKVHSQRLKAGRTYIIANASKAAVHTVLGITRPTVNLSILGENNPLVIADNNDLMKAYDGKTMWQSFPSKARL